MFGWRNPESIIKPTITTDLLHWERYGAAGITDAESIERCRRNRVPEFSDVLSTVLGTPEVFADYMRFTNGTSGYSTNTASIDTFTIYAVTRCVDPQLGVVSASDRGYIAGWGGGANDRGPALLHYSLTQARGIYYENPAAPAAEVVSATSDPTTWAIYAMQLGGTSFEIFNLTDATTGSNTATEMDLGGEGFSIGIGWGNYLVIEVDIQTVVLYGAAHDAGQRAAVYADLQAGLVGTSITEGA